MAIRRASQLDKTNALGERNLLCSPLNPLSIRTNTVYVFLAVFTVISQVRAQPTPLEKAALERILESYPDLASVPLWEQSPRKDEFYGRSWTNDFQTLCASGDGYDLYGVFCKNGHVAGLRVTAFWGNSENLDFTPVKELIYLRNLYESYRFIVCDYVVTFEDFGVISNQTMISTLIEPPSDVPTSFFEPLMDSILANLPIEHLEVPASVNFRVSQPSALQYLYTFNSDFVPYSNFSNLRVYDLSDSGSAPTTDWRDFHPNLEEIHLHGSFDISLLLSNISNFPSLKKISCRWCIASNPNMQLTTSTLRILDLNCDSYDEITSMVIVSPTLETLYICTSSVSLTTPNLKHIESGPILGSPSLPQLESLSIYSAQPVSSTMDKYICDIASQSVVGLAELYISYVNQTFVTIPPCFKSTNLLRYLYLEQAILEPSTIANIPSAITSVELINLNSTVTMSQFQKLPYISYLVITDYGGDSLTGPIPENFFQVMPNLKTLRLYSTGLTGTIPWYGWSRLTSLDLFGSFEAWPGIDAAPGLEYLSISSDVMTVIPSDELFNSAGLTSLVDFKVNYNFDVRLGLLTGPMPAFWTSLPYLRLVYLAGNLSGTLPSPIAAPRLESLDFFTFDITCGGLPEIAVPISLRTVDWSENRLMGTIPASWGQNLTVIQYLDLSLNSLTGTIPAHFLEHHTLQLSYVDFSYTYMEGAIWNMSQSITLGGVSLSESNFNVCAALTSLPKGFRLSDCEIDRVPECPVGACLTAWNNICDYLTPCSTQTHSLSTGPSCLIPPPRATARLTYPPPCPQPAPEGFICDQGTWMWPINYATPYVSIPGGLGVIFIQGNVSAGTIHFAGEGTTLVVCGCVEKLEQVLLTVNPDAEPFKQDLIQQKGSGCSDLRSVPVQESSSKKSCKEPRLSTSDSTLASLSVAFTISNSKCNTKWIIIGCVLGALAVIAIVVAVVIIKKQRSVNSFAERKKLFI